MIYLWITLFVIAIISFWLMNVLGLPGNWLAVGLVALWLWLGPETGVTQIGWPVLVAVVVLATLGEIVEFVAGMIGAKKVGGSKRATWLALAGSIIGAIVGAFIGLPIPIPLVGMVISSLFFSCAGAFGGALIGEKWAGKPLSESLQVGGMAFVGRLFGTLGKVVAGTAISIVAILGLFL